MSYSTCFGDSFDYKFGFTRTPRNPEGVGCEGERRRWRRKRAVAGEKYERTRCNALHRRTRQYFSQGLSNPTPTTTKNHLKSRNFGWFAFLYKSLKMAFSNEILMSCIFFYKKSRNILRCTPKSYKLFGVFFCAVCTLWGTAFLPGAKLYESLITL